MCGKSLIIISVFFCSLVSVSVPVFGSDAVEVTISKSRMENLLNLSQRLEALNLKLKTALQNSQASFQTLQSEYEALKAEYEVLKAQSTELEQTSTVLSDALKKAETSFQNLTQNFEQYKKDAEARIHSLELQRNVSILAGIGGIVLALIFF